MEKNSDYLFMNNNSIYRNASVSTVESAIAYTTNGSVELNENESEVTETSDGQSICAKSIKRSNGTTKYLVRLDSNGKLFNPYSIYGEEKNKTFLDRVCRSNQKFKEVSAKVMELYLVFLQKQNIALLTNAEREAE